MIARTDTGPALHIGELRLVTDGALAAGHGRAIGEQLGAELGERIARAATGTRLRIDTLVVHASGAALSDTPSRRRLADRVARELLARVRD